VAAVKTLCSLVNTTNDKLVCSKVFRCLAVQSLPKDVITARVIACCSQINSFVMSSAVFAKTVLRIVVMTIHIGVCWFLII